MNADDSDAAGPGERRKTVLFRRVGVTACILALLAAVLGLLGKGPLSRAQQVTPDAQLRVRYERFVRYQAETELTAEIAREASQRGEVLLQVSREFVKDAEIKRIDPEPESTTAGPEFFTYRFRAETNGATTVRVRYTPAHFGPLSYQVRLATGPSLHLKHMSFP